VSDPTRLAAAIALQAAWLDTVHQPGGYGGPVAHWWQHRFRSTGPGLDWRYEGILLGYRSLLRKSDDPHWGAQLRRGADDLVAGQRSDGHYRSSRFEVNPGSLGTPHEAAATLGLLAAAEEGGDAAWLDAARRNLDALIAALDDGDVFVDVPGSPGRVPNKLATFAQALLRLAGALDADDYRDHARSALDGVLALQVTDGPWGGAVHQYAPDGVRGDGRFFPYYNARCVPPLLEAATTLGDERYRTAADGVLDFLEHTVTPDGAWPQIVYRKGRDMTWPRWLAGAGDILLAFHAAGRPLPAGALERLLASQLPSGGFPTGEGFASQLHQAQPDDPPDFRDLVPVAGWNDKTFRLLCALLPEGTPLPNAAVAEVERKVRIGDRHGTLFESAEALELKADGATLYRWYKDEPWARTVAPAVDIR
jgi:hypothetical protein